MNALTVQSAGRAVTDAEILEALEQHAEYARGAFAPNTERALAADTAIFTAWCSDAGLASLPATSDTLVRFIDAMAAVKAPATVRPVCVQHQLAASRGRAAEPRPN